MTIPGSFTPLRRAGTRAVAFLLLCAVPAMAAMAAEEDTEPVRELKRLYASNVELRQTLERAFAELQERPNAWQGKNLDDFYAFFNAWYSFLPLPESGLRYIGTFWHFYNYSEHGMKFVTEEPGRGWVRDFVVARARFMDSPESIVRLAEWMRLPTTHMEEYQVPTGGFRSFNEFFTRRLKPGTRPIAAPTDDAVVAAPADCQIGMLSSFLQAGDPLPVKGQDMQLADLLNGSEYAARFVGGSAVNCVLMPTYYHRFHAPVSGTVVHAEQNVPGIYFGQPSFAESLTYDNVHRGFFVIATQRYGHVGMVAVGLNTISSVQFAEPYRHVAPGGEGVPVVKGQELGFFAYGGSLVILLFEPERLPALGVHQGQRIGTLQDENP